MPLLSISSWIALAQSLGQQSAPIQRANAEAEHHTQIDTPRSSPNAEATTVAPEALNAKATYVRSLAAMRRLALPPFVTYGSTWTSVGQGFDISQNGQRIALSIGSSDAFEKRRAYSVVFRTSDGMQAATEDANRRLVGQNSPIFNPTWIGAYAIAQYGLYGPPPPITGLGTPTPSSGNAELPTIGTVAAKPAEFYRIANGGPKTCPSGTPGNALELTAFADPQTHPLTQVTIEKATRLMCSMRFSLDQSRVAGLTGSFTFEFGSSGAYWLVSGGSFDVWAPNLGFSARHVTLRWVNSAISTPDDLPSAAFAEPTTGPDPTAT